MKADSNQTFDEFLEQDMQTKIQEDTKQQINNLLWAILPDSTTLARAEAMAVKIYEWVVSEFERDSYLHPEKIS